MDTHQSTITFTLGDVDNTDYLVTMVSERDKLGNK